MRFFWMPSRGSGCPTGQGLGTTVLFRLCGCVPFCRTVFFAFAAFWCCVVPDKNVQLQWKGWHRSWQRGHVVNALCNIAQHETLPRRTRKACERNKQDTLLGVLGFCLCFFFSVGQITVGRFNGHYYIRKKAEGDSMPDVLSPSVVSLCVLQFLEHRLYWGIPTSRSTHSSHIKWNHRASQQSNCRFVFFFLMSMIMHSTQILLNKNSCFSFAETWNQLHADTSMENLSLKWNLAAWHLSL